MVIDKEGFIWAATFDGLNRFDGSSIKIYRNNPEDKTSIASSKINKLFADENHHLYLLTNLGFSIFDTRTGKTVHSEFVSKFKPNWLCSQDEYHVWMTTTNNHLLLVDTRTFLVKKDYLTPQSSSCALQSIIYSNKKILQINTCGEIKVFEIESKKMIPIKNEMLKSGVASACLDKNNDVIISSNESGLLIFDMQKYTFKVPEFQGQNDKLIGITKVHYNSSTNTLLFTSYGQGLFVYDYSLNKLYQFRKNEKPISLSANYPISVTSNSEGIIFLGYDGMGIDMIDPNIKKFNSIIKDDANDYETLKFVRKIIEGDDGYLYIGTSGSGLIRYHRTKKTFDFFHMKNTFTQDEQFVIEMFRINQSLFLGYNGSGVEALDIPSMKIKHKFTVGNSINQISNGVIWSFCQDNNFLWIGTRENGLNKVDLKSMKVEQFDTSRVPAFRNNGIRCLNKINEKTILIGTEKGLYQLNVHQNTFRKIFPELNDTLNQSYSAIKCIYVDDKSRTWLGTDGGGILVLNPNYKVLKKINTNNFLTSNVVYSILPQNDSTFWISTNSGLSKITWNEFFFLKNTHFLVEHFDEANGLQSNEFNTGAYNKLSDGSLAFGGLNGMNIFKGEEIISNKNIPKVYINEFKVFENDLKDKDDILFKNKIDLQHFENSVSISFNTLSFTKPEKIKYKYRLVGYDKDWINSNNRNYISYTNLNSGAYEFQVKACNYDGIWSDSYTSLQINIATPFYRNWWFIVVLIYIFAQLSYFIYRFRINQIKEKEKLIVKYNKDIAEVEMKALRAQINPHFVFNSLNSINNYILKNDTKLASRYLVKFSQLVRSILNNSTTPYISLQEELQTIELYMLIEGMRFNNQFSYTIKIDPEVNISNVQIPSLLLQPYVENAIWHGLLHKDGEKLIVIEILQEEKQKVKIIIEDNGVGRQKSVELEKKTKKHQSFGMQLGENRLKLMNQESGVESKVQVIDLVSAENEAIGTQIVIQIPIIPKIKPIINLN